MILTVTLNPAIDRAYRIDGFHAGGRFRIFDVTETIGGKGINVAKILRQTGYSVFTTGFYGGYNGKRIVSSLEQMGITNRFVEIQHESRNFSVINDLECAEETILNEAGPHVSEKEIEKFMNTFRNLLTTQPIEWVVIAGSVPQGVDDSIYYDLTSLAKKNGKKVVIDGKTPYLNKALLAKPDLIKPNMKEFMEMTGMKEWRFDKAIEIAKYMIERYQTKLLLSLGKEGAVYLDKEHAYRITFKPFIVQNTIGSGDSMVAGFLTGLMDQMEMESALKRATAYSLSNAMHKEIGCIDQEHVLKLKDRIHIERI